MDEVAKTDTVYSNSEKVLKLDAKRREYDIIVIGEEAHLAYNRVGLTSFFQHRKVENLYLNPQDWVSPPTPFTRERTHWLTYTFVLSTQASPGAL